MNRIRNFVLNVFYRNKNRALMLLRRIGLYRGPIHHRMYADIGRLGATGKDI